MPSYRGIDRDEVFQSIKDALALLHAYPLGPAWKFRLAGFHDPNDLTGLTPMMQIAGARNDAELLDGLKAAGVRTVFPYLKGVFAYHAFVNTDGIGEDVLKRLAAWSAFTWPTHDSNTHQAQERRLFMVSSLALHVPLQQGFGKLRASLRDVTQDEKEIARAAEIAEMIVFIASGRQPDDRERIEKLLNSLDEREQNLVLYGIGQATDIARRQIPTPSAIKSYGLIVPDFVEPPLFWAEDGRVGLYHRFLEALAPFVQSEDVVPEYNDIGDIGRGTDKIKPRGFVFAGTRKAAEKIAAEFPGYKVVDFDGNAVTPPSAGPKKPSGHRLSP